MEYRKDKRTMNLTLRSIHVGDWVQVWSEQAERYSPPLKITQICDDGTIYLIGSDEERLMPWEESIKNVDALPITPELLKGFGFELKETQRNTEVTYDHRFIGYLFERSKGEYHVGDYIDYYCYMHKLCHLISGFCKNNLEWKGIEK